MLQNTNKQSISQEKSQGPFNKGQAHGKTDQALEDKGDLRDNVTHLRESDIQRLYPWGIVLQSRGSRGLSFPPNIPHSLDGTPINLAGVGLRLY